MKILFIIPVLLIYSCTSYKYENKNEGFDYLSETSDDDSDIEDDLNWVNYKQSYFSSFLRPEKAFKKSGTKLAIKNFEESDIRYNSHVKSYLASLNIGSIENSSSTHFKFSWYFGPNDDAKRTF